MRKILVMLLTISVMLPIWCHAEWVESDHHRDAEGKFTTAPAPLLTAKPTVVYTAGPLNVYNPATSPRAVYYFDVKRGQNYVGGEIPLFSVYTLEGTFGLATDVVNPNGANPFIGANLRLPNPLPQWMALDTINPGVAAGWNIAKGEYIFALKASIPIGH